MSRHSSTRGFDQKFSFAWLIVFMFLTWHGHFLPAACLGGLPWMIHRKWERTRQSVRTRQ